MSNKSAVVIVSDGIVESVRICTTLEEGETRFLQECADRIHNWSEYTSEDVTDVVEQGYERYGDNSINLVTDID